MPSLRYLKTWKKPAELQRFLSEGVLVWGRGCPQNVALDKWEKKENKKGSKDWQSRKKMLKKDQQLDKE